jgi:ABC-type transport system involved in Fe-S cluster assembly fused permease/ATPase subunit
MSNLVDTEQLIDLLNEEKDVIDRPNAVDLVVGDGGIVFDNVKFSYDGKKETIKGISFAVRAGHSVARDRSRLMGSTFETSLSAR